MNQLLSTPGTDQIIQKSLFVFIIVVVVSSWIAVALTKKKRVIIMINPVIIRFKISLFPFHTLANSQSTLPAR